MERGDLGSPIPEEEAVEQFVRGVNESLRPFLFLGDLSYFDDVIRKGTIAEQALAAGVIAPSLFKPLLFLLK